MQKQRCPQTSSSRASLSPPSPAVEMRLTNGGPSPFLLPFKGRKKVEKKREVKGSEMEAEGGGPWCWKGAGEGRFLVQRQRAERGRGGSRLTSAFSNLPCNVGNLWRKKEFFTFKKRQIWTCREKTVSLAR